MSVYFFKVLLLIFVLVSATAHCSVYNNLKNSYQDYFLIGVALSENDTSNESVIKIVQNNFNSVTHEYGMKWLFIQPRENVFDFSIADEFVKKYANANVKIIGHTLVWHRLNPDWLFSYVNDDVSIKRKHYLKKMHTHITKTVSRYKGVVHGWDVVNEAFHFDGELRKTPWLINIGADYIEKAFEYAHQADPNAELYYNDYGLEHKKKQDSVINLILRLRAKGIPIHAVGIQGHYSFTFPNLTDLDNAIKRFSQIGVNVMITELDVTVLPFPGKEELGEDSLVEHDRLIELDPYVKRLPNEIQYKLSHRYKELFCVFLANRDRISRVTFWGVTDARSWRNNWPLKNRTDHPLLYDRELNPKYVMKELLSLSHNHEKKCERIKY